MTRADSLSDISRDYLRATLNYNPSTGIFTWARSSKSAQEGHPVGTDDGKRALRVKLKGKPRFLHRLAFIWMGERLPPLVDHKNGDPSDNRWCNLRAATPSQNQWNRGIQKNNSSGFKGVSFAREVGKWRADIYFKNKRKTIGFFRCPTAAGVAYAKKAQELHGDFAKF